MIWSPADHEGEGLGGDGFVVLVDAVSDAHFHLSLLHAVTGGVVQLTHDPEKQRRAEVSSAAAAVREDIPEVLRAPEQEHLHECDVEPQSLRLAPGTARPNENPLEK